MTIIKPKTGVKRETPHDTATRLYNEFLKKGVAGMTASDWDTLIKAQSYVDNWDVVYNLYNAKFKYDLKTKYPGVDAREIDVLVNDAITKGVDVWKAWDKLDLAVSKMTGAVPVVEAPVYKFKKTPDMITLENLINKQIAGGRPEFTPEYVTKWAETIGEMQKPFEEKAMTQLREEYNLLSPHSYGSGSQLEATGQLLKEMAANKSATALGLGEREYGRKLGEFESAQAKSLALQDFFEKAKQFTSEQEMADYFAKQKRDWTKTDILMKGLYETGRMQDYLNLVEKGKGQWWEKPLGALATGVGTAVGGPLGGGIANWLLKAFT